jgi:uncharacterized protein YggE
MRRVHLSMLAAIACLAAAILAAAMPPGASAQAVGEGRIRVLGRATVEAVPDLVSVRVGISNKAPSPTAALDQNSAVARKIIEFSKKFGIDERNIRTDSINLAPAYKTVREPNGNTRQEPDGYSADNMVRVKLTDVSRLGAFMRQVLDQGATNIGGVSFGLSNPEKFADDAGTKAVEDAVRQARLLADAAKVKLGSIQEIVHPPRSEFRGGNNEAALRGAVKQMAVPVEAGVVEITSEVEMTWRIE